MQERLGKREKKEKKKPNVQYVESGLHSTKGQQTTSNHTVSEGKPQSKTDSGLASHAIALRKISTNHEETRALR